MSLGNFGIPERHEQGRDSHWQRFRVIQNEIDNRAYLYLIVFSAIRTYMYK
jgi:hypothetical protein